METSEIRDSLNYTTYIEHSLSLKSAADENLKLFISLTNEPFTEENRIKGLGLYRASLILYSVSVELIIKARGLFYEIERIKAGQINTYKDFLKEWNSNSSGHSFDQLLPHYNIHLNQKEKDLIGNLQPYSMWDGRFPFPIKEELIIEYENGMINHGVLKENFIVEIDQFIQNQLNEMSYNGLQQQVNPMPGSS